MNSSEKKSLQISACRIRMDAVTGVYHAKSGHPGGSLSAADLLAYLYFKEMKVDPKDPKNPDRDRLVLSKGHVCPIQYACLTTVGFFPESVLDTLRKEGSMLQGHPSMLKCPGIDISTGSLGQGASCAVGMALAGKRDHKDYRVFTLLGDGEMDECIVWEAMMCANRYQLDNFVMMVDNNGLQLDGPCDQIMPHIDLSSKAAAFGFEVYDIDGHDMQQILDAFDKIRAAKNGKPKFINAKTVKGKGVDFMENQVSWHGTAPNAEQYADAIAQIDRS